MYTLIPWKYWSSRWDARNFWGWSEHKSPPLELFLHFGVHIHHIVQLHVVVFPDLFDDLWVQSVQKRINSYFLTFFFNIASNTLHLHILKVFIHTSVTMLNPLQLYIGVALSWYESSPHHIFRFNPCLDRNLFTLPLIDA